MSEETRAKLDALIQERELVRQRRAATIKALNDELRPLNAEIKALKTKFSAADAKAEQALAKQREQRAWLLRQEGKTFKNVAAELGCTITTARRLVENWVWKLREPVRDKQRRASERIWARIEARRFRCSCGSALFFPEEAEQVNCPDCGTAFVFSEQPLGVCFLDKQTSDMP